MATQTDLDTDVLEGLDSDWEPACEIPLRQRATGREGWPDCPGDLPGKWLGRSMCDCGQHLLGTVMCDYCKSTYEAWARQYGYFSCADCGKGGLQPPSPWFMPL